MGEPPTTLQVLGPVGAQRGDEPLRVGGPRQRALLAVFAMRHGQWLSADQLVEEVFRGEPTEGAETTLRSYVSRLRAALGDDVRITGGAGYRLETTPEAIDAIRFEALVAEADDALAGRRPGVAADRLRTALALWRGEPFGGLGSDGLLRVEAERLQELRVHAIETRIEADLALGAAAALVDELEVLVHDHPFREAFWCQLMLALYRSQRQADALAAYHRARAALDEQLGIEPGDELVALEAAILRHEVPEVRPPTARHNLPAAVTSFVGRDTELAWIEELLSANRLVTLTGVGGVGKTRLAIEAARGLAQSFADGIGFIDLAPLADGTLVADQITTVLDVRGTGPVEPIERLVAHLGDLEVLLVLDNCEHLLGATAEVAARLLSTCPGLRILATSRELLGVEGEADAAVPPLGIPSENDSSVRASEAVQLFMARARAARPGLLDDDQTIATVARICADLEGIPLAIELAAARARVLSPAEIDARLRDRFQFLVSWRRLSTARHRTLREAMDWSYDLLDQAGRRLLAELSVFAGGFTLDAVEGVCTFDDAGTALDLLQRLAEASLVTVEQDGELTRYGLLETIREYGSERLEVSGGSDELHRRHARYFAALAESAFLPIRHPSTQEAWLARLRAERDNIRAALGWSLDHDEPDLALRITDTMWWYWWRRNEAVEGRTWLERALAADHRDDPWRRARCSLGLAGLLWSLGDLEAAIAAGEEARALADPTDDAVLKAGAANTLGLIALGLGDKPRARAMFEESVAGWRSQGVPPELRDMNLAIGIDNLGTAAHDMGDDTEAMRYYLEARALNAASENAGGVAMNDLHLSILEAEAGRPEDARRRLRSSLQYYGELGFLHYAAGCLEAAAAVANGLGAPAEAADVLGGAARIHGELANRPVPFMARLRDREATAARAALGDGAFEGAYAKGLATPTADMIRRTLAFLGG